MEFGHTTGSFTVTVSKAEIDALLSALPAPPSDYWYRRRCFVVRQSRKRMARALGVSYADMLHFCRTGKWPRSPMRLRVEQRSRNVVSP